MGKKKEEVEELNVRDMLTEELVNELQQRTNFAAGSKERSESDKFILDTYRLLLDEQKMCDDWNRASTERNIQEAKLALEEKLTAMKIDHENDLQKEKAELECIHDAKEDARSKKERIKGYITAGLSVGLFAASAIITRKSQHEAMAFEETGSFRSSVSKSSQKMTEPFLKQLDSWRNLGR